MKNADRLAIPNHNELPDNKGLTKRELIAAMAMQGMLSANSKLFGNNEKQLSATAVAQADALLAELEKGGSDD